jgi:ABC-type nitrate/sulfonate/bicarbonate transport system substrate-binding protein
MTMEKLRIGLEWFMNPDHVPFLVALEKGWFAEVGLDVELIEPKEHLDAIDEIQADRMDVAVTEPIHLVEDAAKGDPVVGFARFLHTNGGVMYFADSGIERPRDMAGKRIQYPGSPGPGGPAIVGTMIEADGGEWSADEFERVNNSFFHTDALIEDKADVATLAFYNFEVVEARHRGHDAHFFALKDWGVPDFCQLILITTPEKFEARRGVFDKLLGVMSRGIDFLHQHPKEARAIYFARTETAPDDPLMSAIFDATVPCFTFDFTMSPDYYSNLAAWTTKHGLTERSPTYDEVWTNALATR